MSCDDATTDHFPADVCSVIACGPVGGAHVMLAVDAFGRRAQRIGADVAYPVVMTGDGTAVYATALIGGAVYQHTQPLDGTP